MYILFRALDQDTVLDLVAVVVLLTSPNESSGIKATKNHTPNSLNFTKESSVVLYPAAIEQNDAMVMRGV